MKKIDDIFNGNVRVEQTFIHEATLSRNTHHISDINDILERTHEDTNYGSLYFILDIECKRYRMEYFLLQKRKAQWWCQKKPWLAFFKPESVSYLSDKPGQIFVLFLSSVEAIYYAVLCCSASVHSLLHSILT